MSAEHFAEIERALVYVSEARERVEQTARSLVGDGAQPHLVEALQLADAELLAVHRRLMDRTYFAAPGARQLELDAA